MQQQYEFRLNIFRNYSWIYDPCFIISLKLSETINYKKVFDKKTLFKTILYQSFSFISIYLSIYLYIYIYIYTYIYDFYNTEEHWYYGEACSSRTNVCHRSYTSTEPFSPLFRVYHVNVGWRCFNFLVSVNYLFERKNEKWQRTGTITN